MATKKKATKKKATKKNISHEQQIENDMLVAANEVDNKKYQQAWERGKAVKCAKDESE